MNSYLRKDLKMGPNCYASFLLLRDRTGIKQTGRKGHLSSNSSLISLAEISDPVKTFVSQQMSEAKLINPPSSLP